MTRKILPALAMLLVSAVMLTTASFAWLANNTSVEAGSMTVKANTDVVFLQISNSTEENATWGRTAAALNSVGSTGLELVNASVVSDAIKWQTAEGAAPDSYAKDEKGYTDVTKIVAENGTIAELAGKTRGTYVLYNTFYVKTSNENSSVTNLKISGITVVGSTIETGTFDQSLRVLVVAKDGESNVLGYDCWKVATQNADTTTAAESIFPSTDGILADEVDENIVTLEVYVYYDGEDTAAKTDNLASSAESRQITVSFTSTPAPSAT